MVRFHGKPAKGESESGGMPMFAATVCLSKFFRDVFHSSAASSGHDRFVISGHSLSGGGTDVFASYRNNFRIQAGRAEQFLDRGETLDLSRSAIYLR